jgi:hypothetical protein
METITLDGVMEAGTAISIEEENSMGTRTETQI